MIALRDKESSKKDKEYPIVFDYRKFNFSKLEYIEPKKTGNSVSSSIYYRASINKVINLFIRTPVMNTISGICKKNNHYYIDLELNINKGHSEFYDFMNKFDENNKQIVFQNSVEWFNQQLPKDILENYYTPSVNLVTNNIPVIRIKIKSKGDVLIPKIFNNYGTEVDLSYVSPTDEIEAILILDELKFFKEKFTPEWSLGQLKVFKKKAREVSIPDHYLLEDENDLKDNHMETNINLSEQQDVDIKEEYLQKKLEQDKIEKEKIEKSRLEQEKIIKEKLEQERLERLEHERLELLEQERLELLEQERLERLEQERLELLEQERLELLEQERLELLEQERLERLEKERLGKQKKIEMLRKKEEKIRLEQEKLIREMEELNNDNHDNHSENNEDLDLNNSDNESYNDNHSENNEDSDFNNSDIESDLNTYDNETKYYKVDPDWGSILQESNDSIEEIILS
jgi:hypothetical protein